MFLFLLLACAARRAPALDAPNALSGGDQGEFSVPEWPDRQYLLYLPDSYVAGTALPVVFGFHGGGGEKEGFNRTGCPGGDEHSDGCMVAIANREGFALVLPDGVNKPGLGKRSWNAGGGADGWRCVGGEACATQSDDVAYVDALLTEVERAISVDTTRIYATGISNGAAMSHRLACERADVFAAIAPVAGANQASVVPGCHPSRPVPVLHLHGTGDRCWGYDGSIAAKVCKNGSDGDFVGVEDSMTFWRTNNGCTGVSESAMPDSAADGLTTTRVTGVGCSTPTELLKTEGGGHTWPGGWQYLGVSIIGPVTEDFSANELIWTFFSENRRE